VELLDGVERLLEAVTRWHLQHAEEASLQELVETGHEGFDAIEYALETAPPERVVSVSERLQALGVPGTLAEAHSLAGDLAFAPDVLAAALAASPDASPEAAIDGFVAAPEARSEHLGSVMRSLSVGGSDLAGLMVVVRELRALT